MAELHLLTKFGANNYIQSGDIDIFRNSIWRHLVFAKGFVGPFAKVHSW